MTAPNRKPWLWKLAMTGIVLAGFAASTLRTAPAEAAVFVGVGIGVPSVWGYYAPAPYYYPYSVYYSYPYSYYYGYPYVYPAGVYWGRPFYRHSHARWHRHWR
jgi:hypothetical protein